MGPDEKDVSLSPLRLALSLKDAANFLALRDGISLNYFMSVAISEKISRLEQHLRLASWFGPFRQFVLAHPRDVDGLGNIHPVVVAAVGWWESLLSDFQGLWEGWENSFIVFPCFP